MKTIATVDEYISSFSGETKNLLIQLRETILASVPEGTEEKISYGMPAYKLKGMLVYFASWKNHIGFYPSTSGIEFFKNELADYSISKGTVQFPIDKPLPLELITKIVRFRVNENLKKAELKKKK
ncbi:MAG TPA: DUF1801 domain-containing protein [Bacteroidales bacterium]